MLLPHLGTSRLTDLLTAQANTISRTSWPLKSTDDSLPSLSAPSASLAGGSSPAPASRITYNASSA